MKMERKSVPMDITTDPVKTYVYLSFSAKSFLLENEFIFGKPLAIIRDPRKHNEANLGLVVMAVHTMKDVAAS
jgi:hypothetical protein